MALSRDRARVIIGHHLNEGLTMNTKDVARALSEIALLRELRGESAFKVRAYTNAARTIESLDEDLDELVEQNRVVKLRGIGKSIAQKITELVTTGQLPYLQDLRDQTPGDLPEWIRIPSLGPKKIKAIHENLGISLMDELAEACKQGKLSPLDGFGQKTEEKILKGIEQVRRHSGRFLQSVVRPEADRLLTLVQEQPQVIRAEVCGSVRRGCETSKDVDILASTTGQVEQLMDVFTGDERVADVIARGPTKCSVQLQSGLNVDLRVVGDDSYPFALQYFTGSKDHNVALRQRTQQLGCKLNEYALVHVEEETEVPCEDEAGIYEALGLRWIPPEMRENSGEIQAALEGELPALVELSDLQGAVHCHTTYSDGVNTVEQMARGAMARGLSYIVISDHSRSAAYARGIDVDQIRQQQEEIDRVNEQLGDRFRVLKGIESDILADGSLDYPDDVLATFDVVIAAVHSRFNLPEKEQTERVLRAVAHPEVDILAHPTGRLLLSREPYPIKLRQVLDAAAEHGVAVEINAQPDRLDLDWQGLRFGLGRQLKTVIAVDAHSVPQLDLAIHGVRMARKGWCTRDDVLNCWSAQEMLDWFAR